MLSRARLFVTPWTAAHQTSLSKRFPRQEWVAISFSRGFSKPRDQTQVSCISCFGRQILYHKHHLRSPVRQLVNIQFVHTLLIQGMSVYATLSKFKSHSIL